MLLVVLSAVVVMRRPIRSGMRRQLRVKGTDQYPVGIGIDVNLLAGQGDGQTGGMGGPFSTGLLCRGGGFLLGGPHHFSNILFRGFSAAGLLRVGLPFRRRLPLFPFSLL